MRHKKLKSLFLIGAFAFLCAMSCTKKIDDAYLNPNAAVVEPIESILSGVIGSFTAFFSSAGTGYGVQADGILFGRYIQYWGSQPMANYMARWVARWVLTVTILGGFGRQCITARAKM